MNSKISKSIAVLTGLTMALSFASIAGAEFTQNLTVGSRGDDVTTLQSWLISNGYLTIAAPTGYFGPLTKAAVAAYQSAKGITPAVGYFGPITRGSLNAGGVVLPPIIGGTPGCPAGAMYNYMTGVLCSAAPVPVAGCPAGAVYNSMTGVLCPTTTPPGPVVGTEGSITTDLSASPAANANIRSITDVKSYGIDVKANSSDMTVDRADLEFTVTTWGTTAAFAGGSVQNPGNFINTIKAWDGTTLLKSWSVASADFTKDSSDRYHIILNGLGFKVPKGTEKTITFSLSVNNISSTDVPRRIAIQGYSGNTQNIRAVDTVGLQSYTDMSGTANKLTHDFKAAAAATLTVSINNAKTPKSANVKINGTNGLSKLVMLAFDAKSETGDSKITKVYASSSATSSAGYPSTMYLCDGADTTCASPLSSAAAGATSGTVKFGNLSITVAQDTTKTFLIAEDFPSTALSQAASTTLANTGVQFEKSDGSTASSTGGAITGKDQYLFNAIPQFVLNGTPTAVVATAAGSSQSTTTLTFTIPIKATALGGTMVKPIDADFVLYISSSTATTTLSDPALLKFNGYTPGIGAGTSAYVATSTAGAMGYVLSASTTVSLSGISPTDSSIGDGNSYTFSLIGTIINRCATSSFIGSAICGGTNTAGNYRMMLVAASSTVGSNRFDIANIQTWALDGLETPAAFMPGS